MPIKARQLKAADSVGESQHVVENAQLAFFRFFCGSFFNTYEVGWYTLLLELASSAQIQTAHSAPTYVEPACCRASSRHSTAPQSALIEGAKQSATTQASQQSSREPSSSTTCSSLRSQNERRSRNLPDQSKHTTTYKQLQLLVGEGVAFISNLKKIQLPIILSGHLSFVHMIRYMHTASGLFSWSMELLAFASHQFSADYGPQSDSFTYVWHILPCERA